MPSTRPKMRTLARLIGSLLLMALTACAPAMPGQDSDGKEDGLMSLTVAPSSPMAPHWVQFAVAEDLGYFKDNGLDVTLQFPGGSADVLQGVATNRIDIGAPTPEGVLAAISKGQPVKMFYNWSRASVQSLAVKTDSPIRDFGDLRGKIIGVSTLASGAKLVAEAALRDAGIRPTEVTFVAVGTGTAAMDALNTGEVDALMLWDTEYTMMEQNGTALRTTLPDNYKQLFSTTFAANDTMISGHPEALEGFGRAWTQATVWATANPEAAIQIMWKLYPETKTSDSPTLLQDQVDVFRARNIKALDGDPAESKTFGSYPDAGVKAWTEFAYTAGITSIILQPADTYTNDFVTAFNDFDIDAVRQNALQYKPK